MLPVVEMLAQVLEGRDSQVRVGQLSQPMVPVARRARERRIFGIFFLLLAEMKGETGSYGGFKPYYPIYVLFAYIYALFPPFYQLIFTSFSHSPAILPFPIHIPLKPVPFRTVSP